MLKCCSLCQENTNILVDKVAGDNTLKIIYVGYRKNLMIIKGIKKNNIHSKSLERKLIEPSSVKTWELTSGDVLNALEQILKISKLQIWELWNEHITYKKLISNQATIESNLKNIILSKRKKSRLAELRNWIIGSHTQVQNFSIGITVIFCSDQWHY